MTTIQNHVHVSITVDSLSVERANFGTPLLCGYHTNFAERVRTYSGNSILTDLISDGFTQYDPIYYMAQAVAGPNPKCEEIKVGRLALPYTQNMEIEVTSDTEDDVVTVTITEPDGTVNVASYTVVALDTLNDVAIGLKAAIDAFGMAITIAAPAGAELQCVADNAGEVFYYTDIGNCELLDDTPDPGIATDLAAIILEDDDWYGMALDVNSKAIVDAAAGWFSSQRKICSAQSADSVIPTSGTTDCLATELVTDSRIRTFLTYHDAADGSLAEYPAAAWLGRCLPNDPGSQVWAFKSLPGVSPNNLTPNEVSQLEGKYCNHYVTIAGKNVTRMGYAPDGTWIDQTRAVDFLQARIEENVFALFTSNLKVPYNDAGVDMIRGAVFSAYSELANNGGAELADFFFTAPAVSAQTDQDRADRKMRNIQFGGRLTGGILEVFITGNLTV